MLFGVKVGKLHDRNNQCLRCLELYNFFLDDHLGFFCILKLHPALCAFREVQEKFSLFTQRKLTIYGCTYKYASFFAVHNKKKFVRLDLLNVIIVEAVLFCISLKLCAKQFSAPVQP